jgi:hypothetical protein
LILLLALAFVQMPFYEFLLDEHVGEELRIVSPGMDHALRVPFYPKLIINDAQRWEPIRSLIINRGRRAYFWLVISERLRMKSYRIISFKNCWAP